jgi:putative proteasome-type protease
MTYCVGILVGEGLVMLADTRTSAGVDNVAVYRKLHSFEQRGERVIAVASAGNLATSQSVISLLSEGLEDKETGSVETIMSAPSMFKAAQFAGRAIREIRRIDNGAAQDQAAQDEPSGTFGVTLLLGGQIRGGPLRLFMIYSAGNFIEASPDTPYLQIGEHKYGKPILDRSVVQSTSLADALKLGLISMDSTMQSNIGVGLPIDLVVIRGDTFTADVTRRIEESEPYFSDLRERWSASLRAAHRAIPRPPYLGSRT